MTVTGVRRLRIGAFLVPIALSVLTTPFAADAQQPAKVYRIGALTNALPSAPESVCLWEAFAEGMRERGYIEGQHFVIERRSTEGQIERSPPSRPSLWLSVINLKTAQALGLTIPQSILLRAD